MVEHARIADVGRVAPLFDAYRQFYGAEPNLPAACSFLAERLARNESIVLLASLEPNEGSDSAVAGFVQLYPSFSSLALGRSIVLNDLFVAAAYRRRGVARRLIREAVAYAQRVGAVRIELTTQRTNQHALWLYQTHGFLPDTEFVHLSIAVCACTGDAFEPGG